MTKALPVRKIGPYTVSAIGLGCMNLSHAYLPRPEPEQAERVLLHALEAGVTFFDTAALYGFGANEELVGRTLMHRRAEFTLASKCVLAEIDGKRGLDGSPAAISRVLEDSLRRLKTDHIDLYYLHRLDVKVPIEESVGALARAVEAGKIGAIGLSEMSAATLRRAHAVHPIAAMQTEYSPWTRNAEVAVLDACAEMDVAFVAFSPLARGFLAGNVGPEGVSKEDLRHAMPRFQPPHLEANLTLVARLGVLANEAGCTAAQLCLAWSLARRDFVVPIPGTTSIAHLDENLATLSLNLPDDLFAAVDAIFTFEAVSGARYTRDAQAQIDTETWVGEPLA
ncbi:aldo/keto reductase [Sphingobium chungbukense]|uniref:Aldo/keto reductase n=1 Tax=Sphingobium chungbukense TaxID=56193 RepID=A0A0M3APD3_9SPHN|nr:aldo/keto reductase [Sphingobium chungbukense]KKW90781.1 aldo/keto reductase [Sphingobium chungbukense]